MHQVHGADVESVESVEDAGRAPSCDALVASEPGVALLARVADCVPVLLADPATGWIAVVHSGRPGLAGGVVPAAVAADARAGRRPDDRLDRTRTCAAPATRCPPTCRTRSATVVPEARSTTSWGTPALDLGAGVRAQLAAAGIDDVRAVDACTREDAVLLVLPSRRRCSDRFAGVIWSHRMTARADELAANLDVVRRRIAAACAEAGRPDDDVSLVVVTKIFPASDVRLLADLGVTDVGENRHQEAEDKAAECADLGLRWHFIGGLQSNKAAAVAAYADVVESVDRAKLVAPLSRGAHSRGHEVDVLLQVSLDPPGADAPVRC